MHIYVCRSFNQCELHFRYESMHSSLKLILNTKFPIESKHCQAKPATLLLGHLKDFFPRKILDRSMCSKVFRNFLPTQDLFLWLSKVLANERRIYTCNVFTHWIKPWYKHIYQSPDKSFMRNYLFYKVINYACPCLCLRDINEIKGRLLRLIVCY